MLESYCYPYPHPAVTTDVALFTILRRRLQILLIRRKCDPYQGCWALPGGFIDIDEDIEDCAKRELEEEAGVRDIYLEQLYTFGKPDRDPRERVISVVYYGLVCAEQLRIKAASDAADAAWFAFDDLPELAFDHDEIVKMARHRLVSKLDYSTIAFQFMPETFTLSDLQRVYEILRGEEIDKRNFRKWILSRNLISDIGEKRRNGNHRPAKMYRVNNPGRIEILR